MIIYRYILKAHLGPFIFALSVVIFLFLFQFLIKSIDQFLGKGLSIWLIFKLIALNLAWMLTLAVPMAVLVATLMAYGSLSSSNEITIMKASGISLHKLMLPVIIASAILCYLMVRFNNEVLPEANHSARVLLSDISRTKPSLILEEGKFSDDIGGAKILVRKTFENSNKLEGIYVYDYSGSQLRNLFTAKEGDIGFSKDLRNVIMNLSNGEIHQINNQKPFEDYRKIKFDRHRIILDARSFGFQQTGESYITRGDRELSAAAMNNITDSLESYLSRMNSEFLNTVYKDLITLSRINFKDTIISIPTAVQKQPLSPSDSLKKTDIRTDTLYSLYSRVLNYPARLNSQQITHQQVEKQIYSYDVEIYKKYSIPFACLIFALIGAPLGYKVRKGGFGIAAGFSLLFFLVYWATLIGGEKLADRGLLTPFLGMWMGNILLGILGLYLMFKTS